MAIKYKDLIKKAYAAFNGRDIEKALSTMHQHVQWPKAFEGGYVSGHDEIKEYWNRQWKEINPNVEPVGFKERKYGSLEVEVHQKVKDIQGNSIFDGMVKHIYTFEDGLIKTMDIEQVQENKRMINTGEIILRPTEITDLELFFTFQLDKEACYLAAFTPKDPADKTAYIEKYTKLLKDPVINMRTIIVGNTIIGSIAKFEMEGDAEITYWIDKNFWGKGVATAALKEFLIIESTRPIFGRVAFDNIGSQRVLEKCRFVRVGIDKGFANARQREIEEFIYKLT
jgi:[ribosomal protein S5]-alanine N-acetyltransferase